MRWFFASDLHGQPARYERLLEAVRAERPAAVLLGGDLLPAFGPVDSADFLRTWLAPRPEDLRRDQGPATPALILILGNDDPRVEEATVLDLEAQGLCRYAHGRSLDVEGVKVFGYSYVPPTPFQLKDWERYDVSRFVDPGCISPEGGVRSVPLSERDARWSTIALDLAALAGDEDLRDTVWLFHSPPYQTALDRAALDGRTVDHAPVDVHVGSIAVLRFIRQRRPRVTLHGHVHESARITGAWSQRIGETWCLGAAHDGPELALVDFDPRDPATARRRLL